MSSTPIADSMENLTVALEESVRLAMENARLQAELATHIAWERRVYSHLLARERQCIGGELALVQRLILDAPEAVRQGV